MDLISLALTIIFGVISIFLAWKAIFRTKIQLITESSTLLANLSKASSELIVFYKNDDVSNDLILVTGFLINSGNNDINKTDFEKPIILSLPDNGLWHAFNIRAKTEGMEVGYTFESNKLLLDLGLWKKEEGFYFDALISIKDGDDLKDKIFDEIEIKTRIHNFYKVDKKNNLPNNSEGKRGKKKILIAIISNIFLLVYMGVGIAMYCDGVRGGYIYNFYNDKNELLDLDMKDSKVIVINKNTKKEIENVEGFYKMKPRVYNKEKVVDKYMGIILSLASFSILCWLNYKIWSDYRMNKRVRKIKKLIK
ncbi:hypothetical protein [Acinetobacter sp.]|uniref:hypothetical protein n=1 Tax=Acinetobacter sp. TaxID=472 RepID=UPI003B005C96